MEDLARALVEGKLRVMVDECYEFEDALKVNSSFQAMR